MKKTNQGKYVVGEAGNVITAEKTESTQLSEGLVVSNEDLKVELTKKEKT